MPIVNIDEKFSMKIKKGPTYILNYPTANQLALFERKRKTQTTITQEYVEFKGENIKPFLYLFDLCVVVPEGCDSQKWKEKVQPLHKKYVVEMLFKNTVLLEEEVKKEYGGYLLLPVEEKREDEIIVYLLCIHNCRYNITRHHLKTVKEEYMEEWEAITSAPKAKPKKHKIVQVSNDTAEAKIELYDKMFMKSAGYDSETDSKRIPAIHKLEVLQEIFASAKEEMTEVESFLEEPSES